MNRERSPNYPGFPLEDAIKNVQALFKVASRTAVAPIVAVKAWGYTGLNGVSRVRLAALRYYGLIEIEKSGNIKLSRRGLTVSMRSPDSPEYGAAIKEAALAPIIFQELYESQRGVADEALKHYLVADKKFSPDGAKRVIETYRATIDFANLDAVRYNDDIEEEIDMPQTTQQTTRYEPPQPARSESTQSIAQYRWPLTGGVTAEVTFIGSKVTSRELKLLREYLKLAEIALDGTGESGTPDVATAESE